MKIGRLTDGDDIMTLLSFLWVYTYGVRSFSRCFYAAFLVLLGLWSATRHDLMMTLRGLRRCR
jgi:hypothetical protein